MTAGHGQFAQHHRTCRNGAGTNGVSFELGAPSPRDLKFFRERQEARYGGAGKRGGRC